MVWSWSQPPLITETFSFTTLLWNGLKGLKITSILDEDSLTSMKLLTINIPTLPLPKRVWGSSMTLCLNFSIWNSPILPTIRAKLLTKTFSSTLSLVQRERRFVSTIHKNWTGKTSRSLLFMETSGSLERKTKLWCWEDWTISARLSTSMSTWWRFRWQSFSSSIWTHFRSKK